jgi:hypothetical protein
MYQFGFRIVPSGPEKISILFIGKAVFRGKRSMLRHYQRPLDPRGAEFANNIKPRLRPCVKTDSKITLD